MLHTLETDLKLSLGHQLLLEQQIVHVTSTSHFHSALGITLERTPRKVLSWEDIGTQAISSLILIYESYIKSTKALRESSSWVSFGDAQQKNSFFFFLRYFFYFAIQDFIKHLYSLPAFSTWDCIVHFKDFGCDIFMQLAKRFERFLSLWTQVQLIRVNGEFWIQENHRTSIKHKAYQVNPEFSKSIWQPLNNAKDEECPVSNGSLWQEQSTHPHLLLWHRETQIVPCPWITPHCPFKGHSWCDILFSVPFCTHQPQAWLSK